MFGKGEPAKNASREVRIVPDGPPFTPGWNDHDFGNGKSATRCHAFLLITTSSEAIQPREVRVRMRGFSRFSRKVYSPHLVGPQARVGEVLAPHSTSRWSVSFFVLPKQRNGPLLADIIVLDHLDRRHIAKKVRFASSGEGNLPF